MRYKFTLTGRSAMLMHFDDVQWSDEISEWRLDPKNTKKKGETSGDDRRPAFTWIGYAYHDGKHLAMPSANLSGCLRRAGSRVPMGRMRTLKELAVSGIILEGEFLEFRNAGQLVPIAPINKLRDVPEFKKHVDAVRSMGFDLDVRRAPVGMSKHVRVRPRFNEWSVSGTLEVYASEITHELLVSLFDQAGRVGLGDWRPGSPKSPGPFGMYLSKLEKLK